MKYKLQKLTNLQKKILYWSPHLTEIGTINSVINSIKSLKKFSKDNFNIKIINLFGEWSEIKKLHENQNSFLINIFNPKIYNYIPKKSFFKSRFTYILFFLISFLKLKKILKENEGSILIIHLLTSLPLLVCTIFKLNINIILRISGKVQYSLIRKLIWKICKHKIKFVTCPSKETRNDIIKLDIFDEKRVVLLYDPILEPKKINLLKKEIIEEQEIINKKYILAIGRLTNQKNFSLLIKDFTKITKLNDEYLLVILGKGEEEHKLKQIINENNLQKKVLLLGFKKNVYKYLNSCECFISTSKYEDPGASIVQAIFCNKFVISSNCKNGPSELLINGNGGILFDLYNETIENSFKKYLKLNPLTRSKYLLESKKNISNFTIFRHHNALINLIKTI